MSVSVIGTYHTKVGKLEDKSVYDLLVEAGRGALEDSGIEPGKIGGIWVGNFSSGGFNNQEHLAPYAIEIHPDLRFTPCIRTETACASGGAALRDAKNALEAGEVDYALVIGVEKMTSLDTKGVTRVLAMASYWPEEGGKGMTFPGLFAEYAKGYQQRYGFTADQLAEMLARVSAKNHTNAVANPLAHLPIECTYQDILQRPPEKNPMIAPPLRLTDCSLISDGAAAVVLTRTEKAIEIKDKVVEIAAIAHTTDHLELSKRSNSELEAGKRAVAMAYEKAGITVDDIDVAEVHDCFTITEILIYEAMGLAPDGEGWKLLEDGTVMVGGKCPVNPSGGLKAKGHPVGATGVSMAVLVTRQLLGNAIGHQVKDAEIGLTFNIGGSSATNIVSIFKRVK